MILHDRKWKVAGWRRTGTKDEAKRTRAFVPARPPLFEVKGTNPIGVRLADVRDPQKFEIDIAKKEATKGRALSWMRVWRSLGQAKGCEPICCRCASACPDK
jgi:hypothetical protein